MLQISALRFNKDEAKAALSKRGLSNEKLSIIDKIIELDDERKDTQTKSDKLKSEINTLSKEIGGLMKKGDKEGAEQLKETVAQTKEKSEAYNEKAKTLEAKLLDLILQLPNIPHESVPAGVTEDDNEVYQDAKDPLPVLPESAQPHWELAKKYEIFSLELGVKIAGGGFPVFTGKGARLQRGLINFFLDQARDAGYKEFVPPLMVNEATAYGTGQLPDKEGQMYYIERDNLYMIPTAEVPLTNIYRDEIVKEQDLPLKLTGFTPCFRREAGSYGAHVRGLNRVHQFDKVEIVQIVDPEKSHDVLMEMVAHTESILQKLNLPYRILRLCGGDLGFTSVLTYDFEVYSAAQKRWLEVSSVSNFETFQSNRMKIRFKKEKGKPQLTHTLNGSALALPRIMAAIIENNQTEKGIEMPDILKPYLGFDILD